ncbi:MAG: MATE family efflux transporter [Gemmataceae bacterium]
MSSTTPARTDPRPTRQSARELWRLAWPFILTQSCWTVQIVLDRILLSQSSIEAVGAGISAVMMFWSGMTLFQYTTLYATTFVAQYTGAGQPQRVGAVVGQAVWFAAIAGLSFLVLVPFADPITRLAGHNPELQQLEATYFRCLCFSALPFLVTAAVSSFFAGLGRSRAVLAMNAGGLAVNAFWAIVLIFGKLGFEPMGIAGAGWATVAGTSTSALIGLLLIGRPANVRDYGIFTQWGLDRTLLGRLLYYGLAQGVGACLETLAFSLFLIFIGNLGRIDLAATSIACTLNLLAYLPMMGVGQAIEVLVGQYLGANQPTEAERAAWTGLIFSFSATFLVAVLYVFAPQWLALPFQTRDDPEGWAAVVERVPMLLIFVAVYCLFDSLSLVFGFALRGAGDTRFVTAVAIVVSWPVMVVPSYLAIAYGWGLYVAWAFGSACVILLAIIYFLRFLQGDWKQMRVIEPEARRPMDESTACPLERAPG